MNRSVCCTENLIINVLDECNVFFVMRTKALAIVLTIHLCKTWYMLYPMKYHSLE